MAEYIYTMQDLSKVHPPNKKVVEGVYLSFLPGAKIGVLGANGSGKSSLLRIMAGVDTNYIGEAWAKPGASVWVIWLKNPISVTLKMWAVVSRRRWLKLAVC